MTMKKMRLDYKVRIKTVIDHLLTRMNVGYALMKILPL